MSSPLIRAAYALGQGAKVGLFWSQYLLSQRLTRPVRPKRPARKSTTAAPFPSWSAILGDLRELLREDWRNIEAGLYRFPHDLLTAPLTALAGAPRYFRDLPQVERRRHARIHDEVRRKAAPEPGYPRYYLQNFHYQSDGWLSEHSAAVYDHQVEVLFTGGADAMRRQVLVPLAEYLSERRVAESSLLDLGCGTGRFLAYVKDNYPLLPVTALDLSPPYLAEARRSLAPWRKVAFRKAAAEATGLPSASYDLVTALYLLHELPPRVRRALARETARLLKPGGRLVLLDSLQPGDHPPYDGLLRRFPVAFHEPYYGSYLACDLAALFGEAGLVPLSVRRAFFSKVLVFAKPGGSQAAWAGSSSSLAMKTAGSVRLRRRTSR